MILRFVHRLASRTVQKAHARVTFENARYVREAIERDATVDRLTQERDQALLQASVAEALLVEQQGIAEGLQSERDEARAKLAPTRALVLSSQADIARLERRWAMHTDRCEVAAALDSVDQDKRLENSQ